MSERKPIKKDRRNLMLAIVLVVVTFGVFANTLGGEFVYDDLRQIVRNPLIQDSELFGKALTSDVWAFKGDGEYTASNYWRPTFTAYHILNFQLFGLNPFGWHLLNILLHIGVCLFAFFLLRRWDLHEYLAFGVALIFAVHPVHTESVAWISGSPDLLFGFFFLASIWFADRPISGKKKTSDLIVALVFYLFALGSKEVAMLCFPIYFLIFNRHKSDKKREMKFLDSAINQIALFGIVAVVFFLLRWTILGNISQDAENAVGFYNAVLSVPQNFVFYLKQIIFPVTLGTNYSLRPVTEIGLFNFVLPLFISITALFILWKLAEKSSTQKIGLAVFILPLLPTLNISAFVPDQIVHDRYLYIPLLGFLLVVFPSIWNLLKSRFEQKSTPIFIIFISIIGLILSFQTIIYNPVWMSGYALAKHNIEIDDSSTNLMLYGSVLYEQKKYPEAFEMFDKALKKKINPPSLLGRGRSLIALKRYDEAVRDLSAITNLPNKEISAYSLYQSYEALAIALTESGKSDKALEVLSEAKKRLPIYSAALSEKIAIVLYRQNKKAEALRELEIAEEQARKELLPESKNVFLRLGLLYAEANQEEKARAALQEFLKATVNTNNEFTVQNRKQAADILKKLK